MISRYFTLLLGCLLMVTVHCAKKNREVDKVNNVRKIHIGNLQCLTNIKYKAQSYLKGQMDEKKLEEFWVCMDRVVQLFHTYVRDKENNREQGRYRLSIVRGFLSYYFNISVSEDLLRDLLKSKTPGRSEESLNYILDEDIAQLREFIGELKVATTGFLPHLEVFTFANPSPTVAEVNRAFLTMHQVVGRLNHWLEKKKIPLNFSLLKNVSKNFNKGTEFRRWLDVLEAGDRLLVSSKREASFLGISSRAFELYSRYRYFIKGRDLTHGEGFEQFNGVVQGGERILREALSRREGYMISNDEMYEFIEVLEATNFLPMGWVTGEFVKSVWNLFIHRILRHRDLPITGGLQISHLEVFRKEFEDWSMTQVLINTVDVQKNLKCDSSPSGGGLSEIRKLVGCAPWPLRKESGYLVLSQALLTSKKWTREDLSSLNWQRGLVRQLVRVYSDHPGDVGLGLTEDQLQRAYMDLKSLLVARGVVDPADDDFYQDIFLESNLFTLWGNGDSRMSQGEGVGYLQYVLDGVKRARLVRSRVDHCLADPKASGEFDSDCYWKTFETQFSQMFQSMPDLSLYVGGLGEENWYSFARNLRFASGQKNQGRVVTSHIVKKCVLLSYMETLILKYDKDLNQSIDLEEIERAIPDFAYSIRSRMEGLFREDKELFLFLTFLIKYANELPMVNPISQLFWGPLFSLRLKAWERIPEQRYLMANRSDLARVLEILSAFP